MEIAPEVLSGILPNLSSLESARVNAFKRIWIGITIFAAVLGSAAIYSKLNDTWFPFIATLGVGGLLVATFVSTSLRNVERAFKRQVIPKILQAIDPSLQYSPDRCVTEGQFNRSDLFPAPDRYTGKDFVGGSIGETAVAFSLVHAEEKHERTVTDSNGNTRTENSYETIFRGLFFIADFNKSFNGETIVKPCGLKFFRNLFGNHVELEDPEFNDLFTVTSTDQVEARYILTPSLMEKLKALHTRLGEFRASFSAQNLYLAVKMNFDSFEPRITESFTEKDQLEKIMGNLLAVTRIVEDLGLNVRIWTKE